MRLTIKHRQKLAIAIDAVILWNAQTVNAVFIWWQALANRSTHPTYPGRI